MTRHPLRNADQELHEYKRTTQRAHVVVLTIACATNRADVPTRTFFVAGKAATADHFAKLYSSSKRRRSSRRAVRRGLKWFRARLPRSVAEYLIPDSDVSANLQGGLRGQRHEHHEVRMTVR